MYTVFWADSTANDTDEDDEPLGTQDFMATMLGARHDDQPEVVVCKGVVFGACLGKAAFEVQEAADSDGLLALFVGVGEVLGYRPTLPDKYQPVKNTDTKEEEEEEEAAKFGDSSRAEHREFKNMQVEVQDYFHSLAVQFDYQTEEFEGGVKPIAE